MPSHLKKKQLKRRPLKKRNEEPTSKPTHFRNLFEAIHYKIDGDEFNQFEPVVDDGFVATDCRPGTEEKKQILAARVQAGYPLWHPDDAVLEHAAYDGTDLYLSRERPIAV